MTDEKFGVFFRTFSFVGVYKWCLSMEVNIFVTSFVEEEEGEESSRGLEVIQKETLKLKVCIIFLIIF
jgi:hypothetical protein